MFYVSQRKVLINLIVMTIGWIVTNLDSYLLMFLFNTFERVYVTAFFASCSSILGIMMVVPIDKALGTKKTFYFGFVLATISGLFVIMFGLKN